MQEIKFYGEKQDYEAIETACKDAGVEFERREPMYRSAGMSSNEIVVIVVASVHSVGRVVAAIAKAYEARQQALKAEHRKKIAYTDGYGLHYFQNYKPEEIEKIIPKTVAIYFGDAAGKDDPASHRIDESAA